jgi:AraC-like DNA-binding protein/quercetin dioxygenase-like cupin family protein
VTPGTGVAANSVDSCATMLLQPESYGSELRSFELAGIRVAEVAVAPRRTLPVHAHVSAEVVFVLNGSYDEHWAARRISLRPGSAIFRPLQERHANDFGESEVRALVVSYRPERLGVLASCREAVELPALVADMPHQLELELGRDDRAAASAIEGWSLLLVARVARLVDRDPWPAWLGKALGFIARHHSETITLASVAQAVGLHRASVARAFHRHLQRSVGEVIRETRLRRALAAIRSSPRPLSEIACDCGFFDQAHMGRWVKRLTGLTPGEIRAALPRRV